MREFIMSGGGNRRRGLKSILVEPYLQVKIGLLFLVVNCLFSVLILTVFGYFVYDMFAAVSTYFSLSGQENLVALEKFQVPLFVAGALIFLFVGTTLLISIRYTHGIYGPLIAINRFLDEVLEGQYPTPIKLRSSDQLRDLAIKLNKIREVVLTDQRSGALIAIHRFIDELRAGRQPAQISLREDDPYKSLADKLNSLIQKESVSNG